MNYFKDVSVYRGIVEFSSPLGYFRFCYSENLWNVFKRENNTFLFQKEVYCTSQNPKDLFECLRR
jgi:hypothetical protein